MTMTPALKRIRSLARELAADFRTRTAGHDRNRTAPAENFRLLAEAGLTGLALPADLGGAGLGFEGWLAAAEELGQGCPVTAYAMAAHVAATGLLFSQFDPPRRIADLVLRDGVLITMAVPEPGSPELTVRRVPGGFRLYGRIPSVPLWETASLALVQARTEEGGSPIALVVPTAGEGIGAQDLWNSLGLRGLRNQAVTFEGAYAAADSVLGSLPVLPPVWAMGPATAACLGIGLGILNQTRLVLSARQGAASADAERRLALMACELEAARLSLWQGARLHSEGASPQSVARQFLIARYLTCSAVAGSTRNCVVACGPRSLLEDLGLEQLIRDALTAAGQSPDEDQCLRQIASVELGGLYRPGAAHV
ncbi:MAG TPA: acyl-CoA dehydrogenase family protein, partial [Symbiobacteriaceae bacterium]|nr:acyl-CoA dehydrogenase family protein [Symbiobacteriaceae bacterium]